MLSWLDNTQDAFEVAAIRPLIRAGMGHLQVFTVLGRPMPQERPRVMQKGGKAWTFTPAASKNYKEKVYWSVAGAKPAKWEPPYTVIIKFICEPTEKDVDFPFSPVHGDLDNLEKSVLDAIFGKTKIFSDDRYIKDLISYKRLPELGEVPCAKIILIKKL